MIEHYVMESRDVNHVDIKINKILYKWCPENYKQTSDDFHVELTNMGKFYVDNVNELRDVVHVDCIKIILQCHVRSCPEGRCTMWWVVPLIFY